MHPDGIISIQQLLQWHHKLQCDVMNVGEAMSVVSACPAHQHLEYVQ